MFFGLACVCEGMCAVEYVWRLVGDKSTYARITFCAVKASI